MQLARATKLLVARFSSLVAVTALVACGHVSRNDGGGASGGGTSFAGAGGASGSTGGSSFGGDTLDVCRGTSPPNVPMRLLGEEQLRNELVIFGARLDDEVFPGRYSRIYSADADVESDNRFVAGHSDFVAHMAKRIAADPASIGKLLDCDASAADTTACEGKLYDFVVARLFRGQEQMETRDELKTVFDAGRRLAGGFSNGVRAVLEVALQSPEFLYRPEVGRAAPQRSADWLQATDLEMASRLSFLLWDRGPDAELLSAAAQGRLTEPADIEAQARRLLADERAHDPVQRFYRELFRLGQGFAEINPDKPEFTPEIEGLMDDAFGAFVSYATFDAPGTFAGLFKPVTWVNRPLANYYGIPGVTGDTLQQVTTDAKRYAGLITESAFLVRSSFPRGTNPVRRGNTIAGGLLCNDVPPEPADVPIVLPPPLESPATTRQRLQSHTSNPICASCHAMMDPLGFAFEHIDETGRYRETQEGLAVDTSGKLVVPLMTTFDGPVELGQILAQSAEVKSCFVRQWERFAFGRAETDANKCTESLVRERFHDGGDGSLKELLVALTQTESFRFKKAVEVTK